MSVLAIIMTIGGAAYYFCSHYPYETVIAVTLGVAIGRR